MKPKRPAFLTVTLPDDNHEIPPRRCLSARGWFWIAYLATLILFLLWLL